MSKNEVLEILKLNSDNFTSGEYISSELGISRSAIWKHIKALREEGHVVESYSRKGYKLLSSPELFSIDKFKMDLPRDSFIKNIVYFDTIDSTNDYCKENSSTLSSVTMVLSDTQKKGRGRFERVWFSPKGKGIFCSLFLIPELAPYDISKITSLISSAIAKALISMDIPVEIKWPNDIYLKGKKIGGILTEMKCDMDRINHLIIGFGINVNQDSSDFPEELQSIATSLKVELKNSFSREDILIKILSNFQYFYENLLKGSKCQDAFKIIKDNSYVLNKEVVILKGKETICGKVLNLGENGELILEIEGKVQSIFSGEVSLRIKETQN